MFNKLLTKYKSLSEELQVLIMIVLSVIAFMIFIFLFMSIKFVGAGQEALKFNRFTGKVKSGLSQGVNFINPITTKFLSYNLKTVKSEFVGIEGLSSDSQTILLNLVVNWRLDGSQLTSIYQKIQGNVEDTIMLNAIYDTAKAELGKYQIDAIAKNRELLRESIQNTLSKRLKENYILVSNVSITNVDFSEDYEKAINAKMIAEQQALEAKNLKEKVRYESEAKALENKNLGNTITPLVLKQKWIEKWDGVLPTTMTGAATDLILNMGK